VPANNPLQRSAGSAVLMLSFNTVPAPAERAFDYFRSLESDH
jgi:hypothetical protein